ncbi:MAG: hypothetical protein WC955_03990 [Elusimicrobiota bacterium]
MKNKYRFILCCLFLWYPSIIFSIEPIISTPWSWPITSDYGPRNVSTGTWFHRGIDYGGSYGSSITPVEGGTAQAIDYDKGWYIRIHGSLGDFTYLHVFTGTGTLPVTSGNWELRNATLVDPSNPNNVKQSKAIILWSGQMAT